MTLTAVLWQGNHKFALRSLSKVCRFALVNYLLPKFDELLKFSHMMLTNLTTRALFAAKRVQAIFELQDEDIGGSF